MKFAARMERFGGSPTMAAKQAAAELRAGGIDVVDLSVGEPDFPTPEHIVRAAHDALQRGETHYSAGAGLLVLREALARYLSRLSGATVTADQMVVTCGGKSALLYVAMALVGDGDEVIVPAPCWVSFPAQIRLAGGTPVLVPSRGEDAFRPRAADLVAAMTDRTRLMIVNSPANPTGALLPESEWPLLVQACRERGIVLLSDETYNELVFGNSPPPSVLRHAAGSEDHVVVVNSFSKTWAMTGWRVGYACAPEPLARALVQLQSQDTTHPATFIQHAAVAALEGPHTAVEEMRRSYAERCQLMLTELKTLPGFRCVPPDGTFYLFPDVREAMQRKGCASDGEFAVRLLREAHVGTVAGSAFAGPGCIRLSYAASQDDLREAMRRIRRWLEEC